MVSSLRIASALLFFVGAHLLVPRIADAAAKLNHTVGVTNSLANSVRSEPTLNKAQLIQDSVVEYEPPNYGAPESEHGSGTR